MRVSYHEKGVALRDEAPVYLWFHRDYPLRKQGMLHNPRIPGQQWLILHPKAIS